MEYKFFYAESFNKYVYAKSLLEKVAIASMELFKLYERDVKAFSTRLSEIEKQLTVTEKKLERTKKKVLISKTKKETLVAGLSAKQTKLIDERADMLKQLYVAKDKVLVMEDFLRKFEITCEKQYLIPDIDRYCINHICFDEKNAEALEHDEGFKKVAKVVLEKFEEAFDSLVDTEQRKKEKADAERAKELAQGEVRIAKIDSILNGKVDEGKGGLGD